MADIGTTRKRLEMQGFHGLDDATLAEIGPWMRWSPALCTTVMVAGVLWASPPLLWSLALTAVVGAVLSRHPFDYLYNHGVRHWTGTRALPPNGAPRRFACALGTAWLGAAGLAFHLGAITAGYALGGALIAVAGLVSFTHYCIPSLIYQTLFARRTASQA